MEIVHVQPWLHIICLQKKLLEITLPVTKYEGQVEMNGDHQWYCTASYAPLLRPPFRENKAKKYYGIACATFCNTLIFYAAFRMGQIAYSYNF